MVSKKTKRIVVCRRSWEFATPRPIVANRAYELVKAFFKNGEGWYRVRDEDGTLIEAPDVFFGS